MAIILLVIIVAAGGLLGFGGWWLMQPGRSNFLSRFLKKMFAPPMIYPTVLISEDGVVRLGTHKINYPGFIRNNEKTGVWHLIQGLSLKYQGMRRRVLILTERSAIPFNPFIILKPKELDSIKNLEKIAEEGGTRAVADGIKQSKNNMIASALVICMCAVVLVFLLFLGFQFWQGGGSFFGIGG